MITASPRQRGYELRYSYNQISTDRGRIMLERLIPFLLAIAVISCATQPRGVPGEPNAAAAEAVTDDAVDQSLVGFRGSSCEGERNFTEPKFKQTVAAAGLTVIVALRCGAHQDLDLAIVQAKAAIDG